MGASDPTAHGALRKTELAAVELQRDPATVLASTEGVAESRSLGLTAKASAVEALAPALPNQVGRCSFFQLQG